MSEPITYLTDRQRFPISARDSEWLEGWLRSRTGGAEVADVIANHENDGVRFTPAQKGLVIAVLNEHEEIAGDDVHGFRDLRDELSRDLKQHPFID